MVSDTIKSLSKNFFSKYTPINEPNYKNLRERANTFQTFVDNTEIKSYNDKDIHRNNVDNSNGNLNNTEKENSKGNDLEKPRFSLNINSPNFTTKNIIADFPTFNPLSNMNLPYNKFDEFDPSAN